MSTSEGKCVLVEVGALISWRIYSYRIVMLLVPYMWASMTFLPSERLTAKKPSFLGVIQLKFHCEKVELHKSTYAFSSPPSEARGGFSTDKVASGQRRNQNTYNNRTKTD